MKPQDNPGQGTKQVQFREIILNFLVPRFTICQSTVVTRRHHGAYGCHPAPARRREPRKAARSPKNRCTGPSFPNRRNASGPAPCGRRSPWVRFGPAPTLAPWRAGRRRGLAPSGAGPSHRVPCFGCLPRPRPRRAPTPLPSACPGPGQARRAGHLQPGVRQFKVDRAPMHHLFR